MLPIKHTLLVYVALLLAGNAIAQETEGGMFSGMASGSCAAEEEAANKCVTANSCQRCEDGLGEEPSDLLGLLGGEEMTPKDIENNNVPDFSNTLAEVNEQFIRRFFEGICLHSKESKCTMLKCCSACASDIEAFYSCSGEAIEGDANLTPIEFECDLSAVKCGDGKPTGYSGSLRSRSGASSL